MAESDSGNLELKITLSLKDYLSVQLWCLRKQWRTYLVLFIVIFMVAYIPSFASEPFSEVVREMLQGSFTFVFLFAVIGGCSAGFVFMMIRWFSGKLPRNLHVAITGEAISIFTENFDFKSQWSQVTAVKQNKVAYFIEAKNPLVRLPKRGFTVEQRLSFEQLVNISVSKSANKLSGN